MIYTLTLNPAVDYVVHIDKLNIGSIMRNKKEQVFFGGKGINVSMILKEFNLDSVAMGFLAGFTGNAIENGLEEKGIKCDFVHLNDGFSRINIKIRSGEETDINGVGPKIDEKSLELLLEKMEILQDGDMLVIAGSVPKELPENIYETIMQRLSDKKISFVVDAEGKLLVNSLKYKPFLIKPNKEELGEIFSVSVSTDEQVKEYAKKLQNMGAENVLVSMGKEGAILLDADGEYHYMPAINGKVVNTVGAGDSMVAGFIAGFIKTNDYSYSLKYGTASGSATAFSEGLADAEKINEILNNI